MEVKERIIRGVQVSRRADNTAYLWCDEAIAFDWADLRSEFTVDDIDEAGNETCDSADIVAQQKYIDAYSLEFSVCKECGHLLDYVLQGNCTCTPHL